MFYARSDFANYFCTYEFLYHQKTMLDDKVRIANDLFVHVTEHPIWDPIERNE